MSARGRFRLLPTPPYHPRSPAGSAVTPIASRPLPGRGCLVAAAALAAMLLIAQPATAAQVSLMPRAGTPARTATALGVGFARKAPVRVRVGNWVRRVRTGPRGRFAVGVRLPQRARRVVVLGSGNR